MRPTTAFNRRRRRGRGGAASCGRPATADAGPVSSRAGPRSESSGAVPVAPAPADSRREPHRRNPSRRSTIRVTRRTTRTGSAGAGPATSGPTARTGTGRPDGGLRTIRAGSGGLDRAGRSGVRPAPGRPSRARAGRCVCECVSQCVVVSSEDPSPSLSRRGRTYAAGASMPAPTQPSLQGHFGACGGRAWRDWDTRWRGRAAGVLVAS